MRLSPTRPETADTSHQFVTDPGPKIVMSPAPSALSRGSSLNDRLLDIGHGSARVGAVAISAICSKSYQFKMVRGAASQRSTPRLTRFSDTGVYRIFRSKTKVQIYLSTVTFTHNIRADIKS